jgi:hypothetical protein
MRSLPEGRGASPVPYFQAVLRLAGRYSRRFVLMTVTLCVGLAPGAWAAELQPRTNDAYDVYLEQAKQAFLARIEKGGPVVARRGGALSARPGREDGIIGVPGGLVHHWIGAAFIPQVTLAEVLDVSRAYPAYSSIYESVIRSTLLDRQGDTYRILLRLKEGEAGVEAVLDVRSTVRYVFPTSTSAYALSNADEIRQVEDVGRRSERQLPPGQDSGYLWRANTLTYFAERDGGVYVEMETIGLSRRFPPLLGWIIEPIARRLGRKSIENSFRELLAGIQR